VNYGKEVFRESVRHWALVVGQKRRSDGDLGVSVSGHQKIHERDSLVEFFLKKSEGWHQPGGGGKKSPSKV